MVVVEPVLSLAWHSHSMSSLFARVYARPRVNTHAGQCIIKVVMWSHPLTNERRTTGNISVQYVANYHEQLRYMGSRHARPSI